MRVFSVTKNAPKLNPAPCQQRKGGIGFGILPRLLYIYTAVVCCNFLEFYIILRSIQRTAWRGREGTPPREKDD